MKIKSFKVKPPCKDCDRVLCARSRNDCPAWVEFQKNKQEMKKQMELERDLNTHVIQNTMRINKVNKGNDYTEQMNKRRYR